MGHLHSVFCHSKVVSFSGRLMFAGRIIVIAAAIYQLGFCGKASCPDDYDEMNGNCYQFNVGSDMLYTWREARQFCQERGTIMLHIGRFAITFARLKERKSEHVQRCRKVQVDINSSKEEQDSINAKIKSLSLSVSRLWIGVSDIGEDGVFKWTNGQNATGDGVYSNWLKGRPLFPSSSILSQSEPVSHAGKEDCGTIATKSSAHTRRGKWETKTCKLLTSFVCQMPVGTKPLTPSPTTAVPIFCHIKDGWKQLGSSCFKHMHGLATYSGAFEGCQREEADMVTINNDDESRLVATHLKDDSWIGLNQRKVANSWVWTFHDGSEEKPRCLNWKEGEPADGGQKVRNCAKMESQMDVLGEWSSADCAEQRHFVCKKDASTTPLMTNTPQTTTPFSAKCGAYWKEDPGSDNCYLLNTAKYAWHDAREHCQHRGGDLTSIMSREELRFLEDLVITLTGMTGLWVGGHDFSKVTGWQWVNNDPMILTLWFPGSPEIPSVGDPTEKECMELASLAFSMYGLQNKQCSTRKPSICKKNGYF